MQERKDPVTTINSRSRATQWLAALIVLPLIAVAALITLTRYGDGTTEAEARAISQALDRTLTRAASARRLSLAVLPLDNATRQAELDYLSSGMAEEMRNRLLGMAGLRLIGSESARNVASQNLPLANTAQLLGASHVLQGSLEGSRQDLTLEFALYEIGDREQLVWEDRWASSTDTLPVTTQAVAARVLETVLPGMTSIAPRREPSGAALNAYMLGKYLVDRYNAAEVLEGITYLDRAIALDPEFERAYATKLAGHQRMTWIDAQSATEHEAATAAVIDSYLALDIVTPLTYRLRAWRAAVNYRPLEAYAEFQRAVQLAPEEYAYDRGFMTDLCKAGYLQRCLDQAQGLARADPVSAAAHSGLAAVYLLLGQYDLMLEHARLSGRFGGDLAQFYEAEALLRQPDLDKAETVLRDAVEAVGVDSSWVSQYIAALRNPANTPAAIAAMQRIDADSAGWFDLFYLQYVVLGELDLAFEAAGQMVERHFETWHLWVWEAHIGAFRNDPRFIELMRTIGLLELWRELGPPDVCTGPTPEAFCAAIDDTTS